MQCEHGEVEMKKRNLHSITPQAYLSCKSIRHLSCSCNEHVINKKKRKKSPLESKINNKSNTFPLVNARKMQGKEIPPLKYFKAIYL